MNAPNVPACMMEEAMNGLAFLRDNHGRLQHHGVALNRALGVAKAGTPCSGTHHELMREVATLEFMRDSICETQEELADGLEAISFLDMCDEVVSAFVAEARCFLAESQALVGRLESQMDEARAHLGLLGVRQRVARTGIA